MKPSIDGNLSRNRSATRPLGSALTLAWRRLWQRLVVGPTRRHVSHLSDRQLRDIGLRRLDDDYWPL